MGQPEDTAASVTDSCTGNLNTHGAKDVLHSVTVEGRDGQAGI